MINCIVMAAGYGSRIGTNKLLLEYRDKKLIEHIMDKILQINFYSRLVVAKDKEVLDIACKKGFKVVENKNSILGQSESIKLGIENSPVAEGYMFFTGDQPLLSKVTIEKMIDAFKNNPQSIVIPRYKERNGSPVIFSSIFIDELKVLEGDKGGREVIKRNKDSLIFVEVENEYELMDIDTWEDYEKLQLQRKDNL
ncbi:molybdenum cofactor cytidylyltransferase [Clostridium intestinale]|uniref:Molybdenum cofactor cytidylyltransferase n=1 Tax=Clostridium intestinale TaxID=36845 RepID=A0A7D6W173_9CLOT|nr:molybdenum cofactor cytidylyltransferase [Clostridium intestinale]QLY80405.1 molybdenum cofactor cytidylyltransferase [Clostridium intestinale]